MKKIAFLLALLLAAPAFAQTTTKPNVSNTLSQCAPNAPLVGNGAGAAPICHPSGALGSAAFVSTGTSGGTLGLLNTANTYSATQAFAALTATTFNGLTVTTSTGTFTLANGKTLTVNNSLTFAGTDGTTQTFPTTNATMARTDAAQTFTGNQTFAGAALSTSPSAGVGYTTGAGGAVTQLTSRTTGVTLNTTTGAITLFNAVGSTSGITFTVTDSAVAATDVPHVSVKSATSVYIAGVSAVAAGSFNITFFATTVGASDSPVLNFAITKGSAN